MFNRDRQIIFPGSVINSNDPMMLGRIRAVPLNEERDKIVKAFCDTCFDDIPVKQQWSSEDPFLFLPLLPYFMFQTPKNDEFVHIIYYDRNTKFKNQFYIQGPFSSPMSSYLETSVSVQNYMLSGKIDSTNVPLKNPQGELTDPIKTKGIYPEPGDNALLGRGSADLILKENEVLLRAGKYEDEILNPKTLPKLNNKRSFVQLSNFKQKKVDLEKETIFALEDVIQSVKYLIEWAIYNPDNNFDAYTGIITIYSVKPDLSTNTANLKINSEINNFLSAPIYSITFIGVTYNDTVSLINTFIRGFDSGKINIPSYDIFNSPNDRYPFAVRPNSLSYRFAYDTDPNNSLQKDTIQNFISDIKINGDNKVGCIIVFKQNTTNQTKKPTVSEYTPSEYVSENVSFGVMGSDFLYLLSHNSQIPNKQKINLNETLYGIPVEKFSQIQTDTNSMVRGEQLIDLLNVIVKFMLAHVHPYHGMPPVPVATDGTNSADIMSKLFNAPNTILNQNIRIN
jgi:hypothetical protein